MNLWTYARQRSRDMSGITRDSTRNLTTGLGGDAIPGDVPLHPDHIANMEADNGMSDDCPESAPQEPQP
jgi:hypothetical protein